MRSTQMMPCEMSGWNDCEVGGPLPPCAAPADVPAPAQSGYTTTLHCRPTSLAGSPTPCPAGWAKRQSATGAGAASARSLEESYRMYRRGPISSG